MRSTLILAPGTFHLHSTQSGGGKTSACVDKAYLACLFGQKVAFVSPEMPLRAIQDQLLMVHAQRLIGFYPQGTREEAKDLLEKTGKSEELLASLIKLTKNLVVYVSGDTVLPTATDEPWASIIRQSPDLVVIDGADLFARAEFSNDAVDAHLTLHMTLDDIIKKLRCIFPPTSACFMTATVSRISKHITSPKILALVDGATETTKFCR